MPQQAVAAPAAAGQGDDGAAGGGGVSFGHASRVTSTAKTTASSIFAACFAALVYSSPFRPESSS